MSFYVSRCLFFAFGFIALLSACVGIGKQPPIINTQDIRFYFNEQHCTLWRSIDMLPPEISMSLEPDPVGAMYRKHYNLRFKTSGREIVLSAHRDTVFCISDNHLFYVDYSTDSLGGSVLCYSLVTGENKWKTKHKTIPLSRPS